MGNEKEGGDKMFTKLLRSMRPNGITIGGGWQGPCHLLGQGHHLLRGKKQALACCTQDPHVQCAHAG